MRATVMVACLLVACTFVAFGYWWKANIQSTESAVAEPDSDVIERPPAEAAPTGEVDTVVTNGAPNVAPPVRPPDAASDETRRLQQEVLTSSDQPARRRALLELGKCDDADPTVLTDVLAVDPSSETRAAAARALSRLRNLQAVPQLVEALADEDLKVRTWAITALNQTFGGRFEYSADAPLERRRLHIYNIRRRLATGGYLPEGTGE